MLYLRNPEKEKLREVVREVISEQQVRSARKPRDRARLLIVQNPEHPWTAAEIAERVGVDRKSVYRWPEIMEAIKTTRRPTGTVKRGERDMRTGEVHPIK